MTSEPNEPRVAETTACTAAATSARPGRYASSSGGLNGIGANGAPTRCDRRVELVERGGLHLRGELGAEAAVRRPPRARRPAGASSRDRLDDRLEVERDERPRIDHLDLDALAADSSSAAASDSWTSRDSATTVTSRPSRTTLRAPERDRLGIVRDLLAAEIERLVLDDRRRGSGSAMADRSRPAASAAVLGITTFRPGTCVSHASRLWECCAPPRWPAPPWVRRTSGTVSWPPDMKCAFAAWLTSWSSASVRKSTNMISTTGRRSRLRRADGDAADRRLADRRVADALRRRTPRRARSSRPTARLPRRPPRARARAGRRASPRRASSVIASRYVVCVMARRRAPRSSDTGGNGLSRAPPRPPARPPARASSSSRAGSSSSSQPSSTPRRWRRRIGSSACHSSAASASR